MRRAGGVLAMKEIIKKVAKRIWRKFHKWKKRK
jgi:hypothetical protein